MHDPRKQERRRKLLKERRAAEQQEFDREDAYFLYRDARRTYQSGDAFHAARTARKALQLNPELLPALELLGEIHFHAGQYADAAHYYSLLCKYPVAAGASYNLGLAHLKLGRSREALADFQDFLQTTQSLPGPQFKQMRENAIRWRRDLEKSAPPAAPRVVTAAPPPVKAPEPPPAPPSKPELPAVAVDFLPAPAPAFDRQPAAGLTDYFLRRMLLDLKLAQNFEDLICLSSLEGVDTYQYQQETVRRVLRHFKGRALLADEVGLGKTIEACLTWISHPKRPAELCMEGK